MNQWFRQNSAILKWLTTLSLNLFNCPVTLQIIAAISGIPCPNVCDQVQEIPPTWDLYYLRYRSSTLAFRPFFSVATPIPVQLAYLPTSFISPSPSEFLLPGRIIFGPQLKRWKSGTWNLTLHLTVFCCSPPLPSDVDDRPKKKTSVNKVGMDNKFSRVVQSPCRWRRCFACCSSSSSRIYIVCRRNECVTCVR